MNRSGTVNLPLHGGKAPRWLFERMVKLAGGITEAVIDEYGKTGFLQRISDPYWFQAFSCVLGFDWHSSGTTTTTTGALKMAMDPEEHGIMVAGGKGKASRKTPSELETAGSIFSLSSHKIERLKYSSRITAKVDNSLIQDGYQLYHHCFLLTEKGEWAVVQQGMGDSYARRYHWHSTGVKDFIHEPHTGIACDSAGGMVLNMTAGESKEAQRASLDLINDGPRHLRRYFKPAPQRTLLEFSGQNMPEFTLPPHHPVLDMDITKKGWEVIEGAYEIQPASYEELVALKGMGPKKIRALALISDLVYGEAPSWRDPVKYSFSHGGKDGFPYPVDRPTYDHSIQTLKEALEGAKVEKREKLRAIKRLNDLLN
jgi:hypothetical protein